MKIREILKTDNMDLKTMLEIRTYIPIAEKKAILEDVLDKCFVVEDGVLTCDYVLKKIIFELTMIKYHTNLDVDIASEEDYDALQEMIEDLHNAYLTDYKECRSLFKGMEQELRARYSIESSIAQLSYKVSNSIEGLVNIATDKIKDFDMSKLGLNGSVIDELRGLFNKYGK